MTSPLLHEGVPTPTDHKNKMDIFESEMAKLPQVELPLEHRFTDGMYIRTIHMPKGTLVTSRTHKTNHPFVLHVGVVEVIDEHNNRLLIQAPYMGTTHAGTRRVLRIVEDAVWSTFHVTNLKDPVAISDEITEDNNDLIPDTFRQAYLGRKEDRWHLQ